MEEVTIEFLGVIIVALFSIVTNVITWFLNYRSSRIDFETKTRAEYIKEALKDHYQVYTFLGQVQATPIIDTATQSINKVNKLMNERPYNFKSSIIDEWVSFYDMYSLTHELSMHSPEIASIKNKIWERISYFEEEYQKILGIER